MLRGCRSEYEAVWTMELVFLKYIMLHAFSDLNDDQIVIY